MRPRHTEALEEITVSSHRQSFLVKEHAALVFSFDFGCVPDMVDVAVGEEEGFDPDPLCFEP